MPGICSTGEASAKFGTPLTECSIDSSQGGEASYKVSLSRQGQASVRGDGESNEMA